MAVIAIDWDHTLFNTPFKKPMDGARDALFKLKEAGHKVVIHSCNDTRWIREQCEIYDLPIYAIWGELPGQEGQKPVASCYVDDRGYRFEGNWNKTVDDVLAMVAMRP